MRILIDMNLTFRWVERLKAAGHHVVHWADVGTISATDQEVFEYARLNL